MKYLFGLIVLVCFVGCKENSSTSEPTSNSGVKKASIKVVTNSEGLTVEQTNVRNRLLLDNKPGSIKHLYVISAYSGQVILYSTVKGKVTSSGKRLDPNTVAAGEYGGSNYSGTYGVPVNIGQYKQHTAEVLQDDGTYGTSVEYLYWFDSKGNYHQHYVSGGQILHISDQPIAVKNIIINIETPTAEKEEK